MTQTTEQANVQAATMEQESDSRRWLALIALCAGMLMIILDATIVTVALTSIQTDLHFSQSNLAWVVNAYLIPFGGLLLLSGRVGDLLGRKRVFLSGLAIFTTASLACGLSDSQTLLIVARFVQGVGGALTSSVILGMIVSMFTVTSDRNKAIGIYSFVAAAGGSIGLLLGGVLTQAIDWHWIFFVNIPIGIATAAAVVRLIPADRGIGLHHGADVPGAVLITSSLMLGVYTIVEAATYGWGSAHTLGFGAVSVALFVGFVVRQATAANPLIPARVLRAPNVAGANVIQVLMVAGMFGVFFLGSLYLQHVLGYDAIGVGLAFLPASITIGVMSIVVAMQLGSRISARAALLGGLVLMLAGLVLFARLPINATYAADVLPTMVLLGLGAGTCFPALMTMAMSSATPQDAGLASGLVNTTQQVGGALGLAVLASLSTTRTAHLVAGGASQVNALVSGYHLAFVIGAALLALALVLAVTILRPVATQHAVDETSELGGEISAEALPEAA